MIWRVLITHEASGVVREAMRRRGHEAWSCDLRPAEDGSPFHIQGDAIEAIRRGFWDLVIMHPSCQYLCGSGQHWVKRGRIEADGRPRADHVEEAVQHVFDCWDACGDAGVPRCAVENPIGILSTRWRKPDQIIQPHQFGEDASKATCWWLRRLPLLKPTKLVAGRCVGVDRRGWPIYRWANQTDGGQNKLPPSADRWIERSRTYPGIADAMAAQWTPEVPCV